MLLAALHSHCLQLLAEAQRQLAPAACVLGPQASVAAHCSSRDSGGGSSEQQLQQQRQAWQLCLAQVQHNLLLVLQLTKHWQYQNAHLCLNLVLSNNRCVAACIESVSRWSMFGSYTYGSGSAAAVSC